MPGGLGGSYTVPSSVTTIGPEAFYGAPAISSVIISSNATSIGSEAFANCPGLTSITVDSSNPDYSNAGGVLFDKAQATLIQYPDGLGASYSIPTGVTSIGAYAFANDAGLTSVTIPASVTSIGAWAFYGASIAMVTIPASVTTIGSEAFANCSSTRRLFPAENR